MKTCNECGNQFKVLWKKGLCKFCAGKLNPTVMKQSPLKGGRIKLKIKKKIPKPDLDKFFLNKIENLQQSRISEESGIIIGSPSRMNIAHLFNKRNHKSVQSHPDNYIFLTADEHAKLDSLCLDRNDFERLKIEFPNSWELMVKRMNSVLPFITENTKFKREFEDFNKTLTDKTL